MASDNWDPAKEKREYVRHNQTGDLGWLVRREGRDCIRYDRPEYDQTVPFRRNEKGEIVDWTHELEPALFTPYQSAIVAYAADREMDRFLGNVRRPKAWIDLSEEKRRDWAEKGPKDEGPRQKVFDAIQEALDPYTR